MKNKVLITAILVFFSSLAFAGFKQPAVVAVDLVNGIAIGDLTSAANSDNDVEFIGCGSRNFDDTLGNAFRFGFCQASDAAGNAVTCFVFDDASPLLDEIRGISDSSFITFSWDDDGAGNLTCTRIGFSTQSFYITKPKK
jgi:hypothetical protein